MSDFNTDRKELHKKFEEILGSDNVYFQPPENYKMKFPCIVYRLGSPRTIFADNLLYIRKRRYEVTFIGQDPVSPVTDLIHESFPYCRFDRRIVSDNKYHDVFTIFY